MNRLRNAACLLLLGLAALCSPAQSFAGSTAYTDTDNENNAGTGAADNDMDRLVGNADGAHPIEFNINVAAVPTTSAVLTVKAYDVDEEQGEVDEVYLNNVLIGRLSGANNTWHASAFTVDLAAHPGLIVQGNNRVRIMVDTSGDATAWVVNVDWGQLLLDGGSQANGNTSSVRITGYSIVGGTVTINTQTTVHATTAGNYGLEVSILNPNGQTSSVLTQAFAATAGQDVTINSAPTYALNGVSGTYTVQAQLFFISGGFPILQDYDTTQFVHTQNVGVTDADADGLTDTQETTLGTDRFNPDTDGDGVRDGAEVGGNVAAPIDTDGDGIINALESTLTDSDSDGINNQLDPANSNPCIPNANSAACLALDNDGDGLTNGQENALGTNPNNPDSDGDGTPDGAEVGGVVTAPIDSDGDGIPDVLESGSEDSDGDGIANSADTDSDNDGIPDSVERGPNPLLPLDTDGDGTPNHLDTDSDGDGVPDALEAGPDPAHPRDTDGDGRPDYVDLDSDNDGIPDRLEGGVKGTDTDHDGIDDAFDVDTRGGADSNHDGISDSAVLPDKDADGTPDLRDLDSDNDGLSDSVEANTTRHDADGDGIDDALDPEFTGGADVNGDGIDDAYRLPDTDSDGVPDFRDLDTDNDGILDVVEGGHTDADANGALDAGQGIANTAPDTDGDGTPDFRDLDSNNDGVKDIVSGGFGSLDPNGDGRIDNITDSDGDGIPNVRDGAPNLPGASGDMDNDGVPDSVDLDIDNDGIPNSVEGTGDLDGDGRPSSADADSDGDGMADIIEAGGTDANGDGRIDSFVDSNHNGLADSVETALGGHALPLPDSDNDGAADYRDTDSDGDGFADSLESTADVNHNGIADYREKPGQLDTAVRGVGAIDFTWIGFLLGAVMLRFNFRRRGAGVLALLVVMFGGASLLPSQAYAADAEGFYVGLDIGQSRLEPEDHGGGYSISDKTSTAFRVLAGYRFKPRWAAELYYVDAGEAGVASSNPAIGDLGKISYKLWGAGAEWAPLANGFAERFYPVLKAGVIQTTNERSDARIDYDRQHQTGLYFGAGGAVRFTDMFSAQLDLMSYDKDELVYTVGLRAKF